MTDDPVLKRFKQALVDAYGDRLLGARLFGSRARGDHRPDSDYDVAVVLDRLTDRARERRILADITTGILMEAEALITPIAFKPEDLLERTILMHELRNDGIEF